MNKLEVYNNEKFLHFKDILEKLGFLDIFINPEITDIAINDYNYYLIKKNNLWELVNDTSINTHNLNTLKAYLLNYNNKIVDYNNPSEELIFPSGERCQIETPPICLNNKLIFAIRIPSTKKLTLHNFDFSQVQDVSLELKPFEKELIIFKKNKQIVEFFNLAIKNRLNISISGAMFSGKTELTKVFLNIIDKKYRIAILGTDNEVTIPNHNNIIQLFYNEKIKCHKVIKDILRLSVDIPIITEIRGEEAYEMLEIMNLGHSGGIFSIHSTGALATIDRIAELCQRNTNCKLNYQQLINKIKHTINIIVYLKDKKITEIWYNKEHI